MRTRRATSARPSRPSRVVKELMAALMRFPAAVYQFSFVNVAPFFPPSVGDGPFDITDFDITDSDITNLI